MRLSYSLSLTFALAACVPGTPVEQFASKNGISLKYSAYDTAMTLTAEAREKAITHCAKYGKYANYMGANAVSVLSTEEVHQFSCDLKKTDDSRVLAAQAVRPDYDTVVIYSPPVYWE